MTPLSELVQMQSQIFISPLQQHVPVFSLMLCLRYKFPHKFHILYKNSVVFDNMMNNINLPPQELLSHSTDRPERQQLKEALEAMQVCASACIYMYVCTVNMRVCNMLQGYTLQRYRFSHDAAVAHSSIMCQKSER